jgi:hypothetical protein
MMAESREENGRRGNLQMRGDGEKPWKEAPGRKSHQKGRDLKSHWEKGKKNTGKKKRRGKREASVWPLALALDKFIQYMYVHSF